MTSEVEEQIR